MLRKGLIILMVQMCGVFLAAGQKTTVINHYSSDTTGKGQVEMVPTGTAEHRIIINYYEPASEQQLDRFEELVSSYLALYVDNCAELKGDDIKLKKSRKETMRDLNGIVKGALDFYEYEKLKDFKGFSKMVDNKLAAIENLDFSKTEFAAGASDEESRKRMQNFYLQKELSDLKLLANMEVGIYGDDNLMVISSSDETIIDDEAKQRLIDQYVDYDPKMPLEPIKVNLSDESLALINFKDTTSLGGTATPSPATDNEFALKVLELLESNNAKLDGMQKQIDDLRAEQMRIWQEQQDDKNLAMQKQIDDLREMVFALVKMNTGEAVADGGKGLLPPNRSEGTVTNLPGSMSIYFDKGSVELNASAKLSLNEIVDILARSSQMKLIVTGYADKTGDAAQNLILSQRRANEVKRFLTASGLPQDRFITKYFGDRDSQQESKSDRRVMIEFVKS